MSNLYCSNRRIFSIGYCFVVTWELFFQTFIGSAKKDMNSSIT
ncbi:hypothetical protein ONT17_00315 [Prevotella copri]|nr:hypothetical protein [Segatella copri]MCW4117216.1 hypothetical protein [Segatella copri]MED9983886.1 hypothetical protein [Segatella copri]